MTSEGRPVTGTGEGSADGSIATGNRGGSAELGERRRLILALICTSERPLSIATIAERVNLHPNTVRFHLSALADSGQVERILAEPAGPGRPPLVFRSRPGMDPGGPRNYRLLAEILLSSLAADPDPSTKAADAGQAWGAYLTDRPTPAVILSADQAVRELVALLDELGFAPERRSSGKDVQIELRHCPFLELVETQAHLICPLHLGLMQGAMDTLGGASRVEGLEPFAESEESDLCVAHVTANPAPGTGRDDSPTGTAHAPTGRGWHRLATGRVAKATKP